MPEYIAAYHASVESSEQKKEEHDSPFAVDTSVTTTQALPPLPANF